MSVGIQTRFGTSVSALAGAGVGALAWVVVVPWDLSTHRNGLALPNAPSETEHVTRLFIALGIPYVVAVVGASLRWIRPVPFSIVSGITWVVLTTWRASVAEVSGANMAALWPVLGIPMAMVGSSPVLVASRVGDRFVHRSTDRTT